MTRRLLPPALAVLCALGVPAASLAVAARPGGRGAARAPSGGAAATGHTGATGSTGPPRTTSSTTTTTPPPSSSTTTPLPSSSTTTTTPPPSSSTTTTTPPPADTAPPPTDDTLPGAPPVAAPTDTTALATTGPTGATGDGRAALAGLKVSPRQRKAIAVSLTVGVPGSTVTVQVRKQTRQLGFLSVLGVAAGPVRFKPPLSVKGAALLKAQKRLRLSVIVTVVPPGGNPTVLTKPVKLSLQ